MSGGDLKKLCDDRYVIVRGRDATLQEIEDVVRLDAASFDACYCVSAEADYNLFRANREGSFLIRERATGVIVGYSMLLPVSRETYAMICRGGFVDTALSPEMVVKLDSPGVYNLYFAAVAVHPEHRGARMILGLLDAMVQDFIDLAKRGVFIEKMLADVVSRDGEKFCRFFGLKKVCDTNHRSKIYEVSGLPPTMRVTTEATRQLQELYDARFRVS